MQRRPLMALGDLGHRVGLRVYDHALRCCTVLSSATAYHLLQTTRVLSLPVTWKSQPPHVVHPCRAARGRSRSRSRSPLGSWKHDKFAELLQEPQQGQGGGEGQGAAGGGGGGRGGGRQDREGRRRQWGPEAAGDGEEGEEGNGDHGQEQGDEGGDMGDEDLLGLDEPPHDGLDDDMMG